MSFEFFFPVPSGASLSGSDASGGSDSDSIRGDLALVWSSVTGDADLALVLETLSGLAVDLATDQGMVTAVLLSLFLDRRAEDDDVPPSGDPTDRRGWWADQFNEVLGDKIGSRLWLLARSKMTSETARRAEEYVREALAWMVEDKVSSGIDVTAETVLVNGAALPIGTLLLGGTINRPGKDPVSFRFAHVWDHMQEAA